jgi:hypothetical protein
MVLGTGWVRVVLLRIRVVPLRVRVVLLQVVLLWRLMLLVGAKAQMDEDAEDVMEHGSVHPPGLLGEVGVVCEILTDLVQLLAQVVDLGCKVHDPPHDQVLITVSCRAQRTHQRTIRTMHTWRVVGFLIITVLGAASGGAQATLSVVLVGLLEVHLCCGALLLGSTCLV